MGISTSSLRPGGFRPAAALAVLAALPNLGAATNFGSNTDVAAVKQAIDRLRVTGSVLMIAAHPDDENTAFLAYCSKGRKLRTGYLALTRGEGGQNLIGKEQGSLLGVLRTQELLAARRIDGAEQFFTRAIDFGFSKTAAETLAKWGHEAVLSDVVYVVRKFRPDVIVLRFSGTSRDGHGHHQASAILGKEAFRAAADPSRFPEQLSSVQVWQARRVLWNAFAFNRQQEQEASKLSGRLMVDLGEYDPVLGASFNEIAGASRSQHRSQGMGSPERKGSAPNYFVPVDGQPATHDFMDEIDTTWKHIPGGAAVDALFEQAQQHLDMNAPEKVIPVLAKARGLLAAIRSPAAERKLRELDETIALAAGLWVDVSALKPVATPGATVELQLTAVNRSHQAMTLRGCATEGPQFDAVPATLEYNKPVTRTAAWNIPASTAYTQPLWLQRPGSATLYQLPSQEDVGKAEGPPALTAVCLVEVDGAPIRLIRPVENRYVDRTRGELTRPLAILPPVTLEISGAALVFPDARPRTIPVEVEAHRENVQGEIRLKAPPGWTVMPPSKTFQLPEGGQQAMLAFEVTPPEVQGAASLEAVAHTGGRDISLGLISINYEHIPPQTVLPASQTRAVREDVRISARQVGYVMGAGDEIPGLLRQLGCEVTLLDDAGLTRGDLSHFDTIITGVRAWNVRPELRANYARLFDYARQGGTVVVQYNVLEGGFGGGDPTVLKNIGPYPIRIGRDRVTVEEAPVRILKPDQRLLHSPNTITSGDFAGWIQERGLYFPAEWDGHYETLLEMNDPGEKPLAGGVLYAKYGEGAYVFTSLAFFRQLPAGVPGAIKLFANLVSAGKAP